MAQKIWGVRIDEEIKEKMQQLVDESGLSSKEFFLDMITAYQINKMKEQTPTIKADIEELQTHTARINAIYINVAERISSLMESQTAEVESIIQSKDDTINLLNEKILALEQRNLETEEQIKLFVDEIDLLKQDKIQTEQTFVNKLELVNSVNIKNESLLKEYQEKISSLTGQNAKYKSLIEQNKAFECKISKQKQEIDALNAEKSELQSQLSEKEKLILEIQKSYNQELQHQKDVMLLEKDKSLLELKQKHQSEIESLYENHFTKLTKIIDEFQNKSINKTNSNNVKLPSVTLPKA